MEKELPLLSSEELKKKLEAGEPIQGFRIERISLGKREITVPINLVECQIDTLDANNSQAREDICIRRCEIDTLVLSDTTFHKKIDFKKSKVRRGRIQRATFKGEVSMDEASLAFTSFHESVFEDAADFSRSSFYGDSTFTKTSFKKDAKFIYAEFATKAAFAGAEFCAKSDFRHAQVGEDLELQDAIFHGELLLLGALVKLSINLTNARLEDKVDFSHAMAGRSIILNDAKLGEKQGFRFNNCSANTILLERETVEGHIFPENEGVYATAAKEYGFLRTTFASLNRFEDEDWAYYQFKRMNRLGKRMPRNPLALLKRGCEYLMLDLGCGYGTKPFRTFGMIGVMVILFTLGYFFYFSNTPAPETYGVQAEWLNKLLYCFHISLTSFSGNYSNLNIPGAIKLLAMLEYLIGVVFMGIFVVSFSRKVIR
jgi:hypothetical protein